MNAIVKNLHVIFLAYACWLGFVEYETKEEELLAANEGYDAVVVKHKKVEAELKKVVRFKKELEQSKKKVQEVVENIERIQRQLPSEINDAEVNATLADYATDLKMLNPEPTPKSEVNNRFYITKDYEFKVRGTYLQCLIFFEHLENLSKTGRILNVKSVEMKLAADADKRSRFKIIDMKTNIEAYKYNKNFNVKDL